MARKTNVSEVLKALLADVTVTEIMVDGPDRIYVERQGKLENVDARFGSPQEVIDWANGLLASSGWAPVREGRPWAEGRLHDGDRLLVVIPPVAVSGPNVVIHKAWRQRLTFEQLIEWGCVDQTLLDFFNIVMQARLNVLVAGGTSSGKTTLANMLVELVPTEERLIVVERASERRVRYIRHERVVHLEPQTASAREAEDGSLSELLQLAARMRPDRIIFGELIGTEALEVLRLMNLGHDGMLVTIHAKSARDALARIETMATIAEPSLTLPAIRAQIASALDLIIYQGQLEDGSRRVLAINEVQDLKGDNIVLQELFTWEKTGAQKDGRFTGVHKATGAVPSFAPTLAATGLALPQGMFERAA